MTKEAQQAFDAITKAILAETMDLSRRDYSDLIGELLTELRCRQDCIEKESEESET